MKFYRQLKRPRFVPMFEVQRNFRLRGLKGFDMPNRRSKRFPLRFFHRKYRRLNRALLCPQKTKPTRLKNRRMPLKTLQRKYGVWYTVSCLKYSKKGDKYPALMRAAYSVPAIRGFFLLSFAKNARRLRFLRGTRIYSCRRQAYPKRLLRQGSPALRQPYSSVPNAF